MLADPLLWVYCEIKPRISGGFSKHIWRKKCCSKSVNQGGSVSFCRLGTKAVLHNREPRFNFCSRGAATGVGVLHAHARGVCVMKTVELQEVKTVLPSLCLRREVIEQSAYWLWSTRIYSGSPGGPWGTGVYEEWSLLLWICCLGSQKAWSVPPPQDISLCLVWMALAWVILTELRQTDSIEGCSRHPMAFLLRPFLLWSWSWFAL